ncbi:MFS transporter, FLVCR family, feline leukemia virus subgroup C receptor-related protein [Mytilus galloprovincialis]|uniref:MFS transporter, FLVCR family, feline leukemia virus subgroup C receptor-related protein n=1 Tax=Mytilus galloprovincialis TaxID=29158 RepID=A0A8B6GZR3_MYTGA|nr:MFS transporter, FLVCR family, feline leukemia virus subgroup C receptor-related protein [Mytilus galloprovincialis]
MNFMKASPSDIHLRRLSLLYSPFEAKELAIHLGFSNREVNVILETEDPLTSSFAILLRCRDSRMVTFKDIKEAIESIGKESIHILCKLVKGENINYGSQQATSCQLSRLLSDMELRRDLDAQSETNFAKNRTLPPSWIRKKTARVLENKYHWFFDAMREWNASKLWNITMIETIIQQFNLSIICSHLYTHKTIDHCDDKLLQNSVGFDSLINPMMFIYIQLLYNKHFEINIKHQNIVFCDLLENFLDDVLSLIIKFAHLLWSRICFSMLCYVHGVCSRYHYYIPNLLSNTTAMAFMSHPGLRKTNVCTFGKYQCLVVDVLVFDILYVPGVECQDCLGEDVPITYSASHVTPVVLLMLLPIRFLELTTPYLDKILRPCTKNLNEDFYERYIDTTLVKVDSVLLAKPLTCINTGSYYAISTLLNPIVLYYFEGHQKDAGQIGLTIVLAGVVGSIVAGVWLDRTKTFKGTTVGIYFLSMAGMIAFTFTLKLDILWVVYLCAGALGFFMTGYLPVGFEFAAEITYPESEGTSSGLLNASAQTFGIILTIGMRAMLNNISILSANITICVALLIGTVITAFIGANYKRQEAGREMMAKIDQLEYIVDEKSQMADQSI